MQATSGIPDTVVIGQDEDAEIRVQPEIQNGARQLDIRIWRRGPNGFSPSHDALIADRADLVALRQGIAELLEASNGGQQVARIVLDTGDGRRLRTESEPFGTRHVVHLGFWQRSRTSWLPDGDGIDLAAESLDDLQHTLEALEGWLATSEEVPEPVEMERPEPWPKPGADWLTVESDRVGFHPRGVRITCSVEEQNGSHSLAIHQWRREDSLWLPGEERLSLSLVDLDALLTRLHQIFTGAPGDAAPEILQNTSLRVRIVEGEDPMLCIEQGADGAFDRQVELPAGYLSRFGRALVQSWLLLAARLSPEERDALQDRDLSHAPSEPPEESRLEPAEPEPAEQLPPATIGPVLRFGEQSETPGAVIPQEGQVRLVVDGYLLPRSVTIPAAVLPRVVTGLEDLYALQRTQTRVGPMLICDRPDCAIYGRVGTTTRPNAVEIRVWLTPRDSESITFERVYLLELIEGLRRSLAVVGQPEPEPPPAFITAQNMRSAVQPEEEPVEEEPPSPEPEPEPLVPAAPPPIHLSDLQIGERYLRLNLHGVEEQQPILALEWDNHRLDLPVDHLEEVLSDIRALYYDALRGRRGQALLVGRPAVEISIRNQGTQMNLELRSEVDGEATCLSFPATEIPAFLNAARAAFDQQ